MPFKFSLARSLVCLLAPLSATVAIAPSTLAATFADAIAEVSLTNFSHAPLEIATLTDTNTRTFASNGLVVVDADAIALFDDNPDNDIPTFAENISISTAQGSGSSYLGTARSVAAVIGYKFAIAPSETFSFNFDTFLGLQTSIDTPTSEQANANGRISFQLFDDDTAELLDSFTLLGRLRTDAGRDALRVVREPDTRFRITSRSLDRDFGGLEESATATVAGFYQRRFQRARSLTLVETKRTRVLVKAPEPTVVFALLGLVVAMGTRQVLQKKGVVEAID
jgi:hypothetical protein